MDSNDNLQTENGDEPVRKRMRPGMYVPRESVIHLIVNKT